MESSFLTNQDSAFVLFLLYDDHDDLDFGHEHSVLLTENGSQDTSPASKHKPPTNVALPTA